MANVTPFQILSCYIGEKELRKYSSSFLSSYRSGMSEIELERLFSKCFGVSSNLFCQGKEIFGLANELMIRYYHNESFIKSSFLSKFANKKADVWAYEVPIGDSRVDLCQLGMLPNAYEIKTEYDNFNRLQKQLNDYLSVFCRVYVILPSCKLDLLPPTFPSEVGIITYVIDKKHPSFHIEREAQFNNENVGKLETMLSSAENDYKLRWNYLRSVKNKLLEIDYQWVYKNSQLPAYL